MLLAQEVMHDQVDEVGAMLGFDHAAWTPGHDGRHGPEGVAIFARTPLEGTRELDLPPSVPSRAALTATVTTGAGPLTLVSGHTALWPLTTRVAQVQALLDRPDAVLALGADLNIEPHEIAPELGPRGLDDVLGTREVVTWPASAEQFAAAWEEELGERPEFSLAPRRIDFLITRGLAIRSADAAFLTDGDGSLPATDHAAIWADVVAAPPPGTS